MCGLGNSLNGQDSEMNGKMEIIKLLWRNLKHNVVCFLRKNYKNIQTNIQPINNKVELTWILGCLGEMSVPMFRTPSHHLCFLNSQRHGFRQRTLRAASLAWQVSARLHSCQVTLCFLTYCCILFCGNGVSWSLSYQFFLIKIKIRQTCMLQKSILNSQQPLNEPSLKLDGFTLLACGKVTGRL